MNQWGKDGGYTLMTGGGVEMVRNTTAHGRSL